MKTELGHYIVNEKIFDDRFEAMLYADTINSKLEWYFFDDVFSKQDWFTEPEESLNDLYCNRAKQIREKYDYIIVMCSGGADSTNVIRSFMKNNIKVDEVIGAAPLSGLKNWNFDNNNFSDWNTISEIKFAMFPLLKEIESYGIKITIYDWFEDLSKYKNNDWLFSDAGNIVTPLTCHFTKIVDIPHIKKIIESGKKVAIVTGGEKPFIRCWDGKMMSGFVDAGVNYLSMPKDRHYSNVDRVLFYWTPDMPKINIKQSHIVNRALKLPEFKDIFQNEVLMTNDIIKKVTAPYVETENNNKKIIFERYMKKNKEYSKYIGFKTWRTLYQRMLTPFIYPGWDINTFQAEKITLSMFARDQDWIHILHKGSNISEMILSAQKEYHAMINPKNLMADGDCIRPVIKWYHFANL